MSDPYGYDGSSVNPDAFVTNRSDSTQETKPNSSRCKHCGLVRQDRIHGLPGEFGAHEFEPVPAAPPSSSSGETPTNEFHVQRNNFNERVYSRLNASPAPSVSTEPPTPGAFRAESSLPPV